MKFLSSFMLVFLISLQIQAYTKNESTLQLDLMLLSGIEALIKEGYVDEVEKTELYENAIKGMLNGLDPHSDFLKPKEQEDLMENSSGKFGGIGIVINKKDDFIEIVSPIDDTPGYRAGLKSGDTIIKIDDKIIRGMSLEDSVGMMRGTPGTTVRLTISRKDKSPFEVKIIRDMITVISAKGYLLDKDIGYIRISNFAEPTAGLVKQALQDLSKENDADLTSIIIDLRNNPGGLITSSVDISDIFLPKDKLVVYTKGKNKANFSEFFTKTDDLTKGANIVVLVNEGSASASEIVSGALQDQKRAVIIGTQTFGKGSVQSVIPLKGGYGIKLTIARYYTPNGRTIQNKGITPDVILKNLEVKEKEKSISFSEKDLENHIEADTSKAKIEQDAQLLEEVEELSEEEKNKQEKIKELKQDYFVIQAINILKVLNLKL